MFLSDDKQTLWMLPRELAEALTYFTGYPVNYRTVHRRIVAGLIPSTKFGKRNYISTRDLTNAGRVCIPQWYLDQGGGEVLEIVDLLTTQRNRSPSTE